MNDDPTPACRPVLLERVVAMDAFDLLADLHETTRFRSMIAEIEDDDARMRRKLRRATVPS